MKEVIQSLNPDELLSGIQSPLRDNIKLLANEGVTYDQIALEMSNNPSFGLVSKGGNRWNRDLYNAVVNELRILICTENEKYNEVRNQFKVEKNKTAPIIVATLSGVLGGQFGVAAGICAPFLILALVAILKVGVESFCVVVQPNQVQVSKTDN